MAWSDNLPINSGYSWVEGTTTGSYNMNYVKTWMEWKVIQESADISANQSRVSVKMYSQVITGGTASDMAKWTTAENFGYAGYDNSNRVYRSTTYDFNNYNRNCFADTTFTIPHNSDGTKSITLQTAFTTHSSTVTGGSVSQAITLPTIARGTQLVSITGKNYGYPSAFNLSRKASNIRERITMTYSGTTLTIKDTNNADVNFTYTLARTYTPNTTKPSASSWTIKIYSYNGDTLIDTKTYGDTWSIKEGDDANYAPTITTNPTCQSQNSGWTGAVTALSTDTCLANYSKLRVLANKANITTKYNSTVASRKVDFSSGETVAGLNNTYYESNIQYVAGETSWVYTVTDSRGFSTTYGDKYPVLSYNAPRMTIKECYRGNSGGTADESGSYIWVKVEYDRDSLNGHNAISTKTAKADGYSAVDLTNNTLTSIATTASASTAYGVTFTVTDLLSTQTYFRSIPSEDLPLCIRENGHGVGIGTKATNSDELLIGYTTRARNNIYVQQAGGTDYSYLAYNSIKQYKKVTSGSTVTESQTDIIGQQTSAQHDVKVNGTLTERYQSTISAGQATYAETISGVKKSARIIPSGLEVNDKSDVARAKIRPTELLVDDRMFGNGNLIDRDSDRSGAVNTGNGGWTSDSHRVSSDFSMKLSANTKYTVQMNAWSGSYIETIYYFNSSKAYLSASNHTSNQVTVTTPNNCAYIRVQAYNPNSTISATDIYDLQLEKGETATDVKLFVYDNKELTEIIRPQTSYHSTSTARSTSLDYSGTNLTLSGGWYVIQAQCVANNNGIQAIALVNNYSGTNYELMDYQEAKSITGYSMGRLAATWCGYLDHSSTSIKVFVKYSGTGVNQVLLRAKKLI